MPTDGTVYKLTGPVLLKQSVTEARINVQERLAFIKGQLYDTAAWHHSITMISLLHCRSRVETQIAGKQKESEEKRQAVDAVRQKLAAAAGAAARGE